MNIQKCSGKKKKVRKIFCRYFFMKVKEMRDGFYNNAFSKQETYTKARRGRLRVMLIAVLHFGSLQKQ